MSNKSSKIIWGIAFVLVGIFLVGNIFNLWTFTLFFNGWWTLFIIIPAIYSIFKDRPNVGNMIMLSIGALLLLSAQRVWIFEYASIWKFIIPIILIIIGISMILPTSWKRNFEKKNNFSYTDENGQKIEFDSNSKKIEINTVFSGRNENFSNKIFNGAEINTVFGSATLNLSSAIFENDSTIEISSVFGGATVIIPRNVNVIVDSSPVFGDVNVEPSIAVDTQKTVYIKATAVFGGIKILRS